MKFRDPLLNRNRALDPHFQSRIRITIKRKRKKEMP